MTVTLDGKLVATPLEAVGDIDDGATVLIGGFGGAGSPGNLIDALVDRGVRDLVVVANAAVPGDAIDRLFEYGQVRRFVATFPVSSRVREQTAAERRIRAGEVEVELVPQGTLTERIRAGGSGIAAFFTPVGIGTVVADGKEVREFGGRLYLLEEAIHADVALLRAYRSDAYGNLVYRATARNFNPVMAMAATTVIAEVEELVSGLDPETIVTPALFVDRVVVASRRPERGR